MKLFTQEQLDFLSALKANNNREWFAEHKSQFDPLYAKAKESFKQIELALAQNDHIDKFHVHRIYRDIRFSLDKTPYKTHLALYIGRRQPQYRGGYFMQISPSKSFIGCGFFEPNAQDLKRFRQEFAYDDTPMKQIIEAPEFVANFNTLVGEELKTAPRGYDKDHPSIALLRKKQYLVIKEYTDQQVLAQDFLQEVIKQYTLMRPFLDYMTEIVTTDSNGVYIYE